MMNLEVRLFVNRQIGKVLYYLGFVPAHSTSIADTHTVGYGELDNNGFWQYPVPSAYWRKRKSLNDPPLFFSVKGDL